MPTTPSSGAVAVLKFGTTTAPAMDWDLKVDSKLRDCANFADGRHQKATLVDADFSCKMLWDTTSMPHDPAGLNIQHGSELIAKCYVDATHFFSVPIVIATVNPKSEIEGIATYDITGKLNGTLVYPVIP